MKSVLIIIIAVIAAILVIGGAAAVAVMNMDVDDGSQIGHALGKVKEKLTGSSGGSESSNGGSVMEKVGHVVEEKTVESAQEPGKIYREVKYDDGNVRQYDKDTGELIGSTFKSDQDKLPSME